MIRYRPIAALLLAAIALLAGSAYAGAVRGPGEAAAAAASPAAGGARIEETSSLGGGLGDVVLNGSLAYVRLGGDLAVVDLHDPARPSVLARFAFPAILEPQRLAGSLLLATSKSDLYLLDVTTPAAPALRGHFTAPGTIYGLASQAGLVYVAVAGYGMQIVDVANPDQPVLRGFYPAAGPVPSVDVDGAVAAFSDTAQVHFVDVGNPVAPTLIYSYTPPLGGSMGSRGAIFSVALRGSAAYLTAEYPLHIVGYAEQLYSLSIAGADKPVLKATLDLDYSYSSPTAIRAVGANRLYVTQPFTIVDTSNPAGLARRGSYSGPWLDIAASGTLAVASAGDSLVALNVANADAIQLLGTLHPPAPVRPVDVQIQGQLAYAADGGDALHVVDLSDLYHAALVKTVHFGLSSMSLGRGYVQDARLYSGGYGQFHVISLADPRSPKLLGSYRSPLDEPFPIGGGPDDVEGSYAYIASSLGFDMIDIANPKAPKLAGRYMDMEAVGYDVDVQGQRAYLAAGVDGVKVIDVSNPAVLSQIGSAPSIGDVRRVQLSGGLLYVATTEGLQVLSVATLDPLPLAGAPYGRHEPDVVDLRVSGSRAFVLGWDRLDVFDITTPDQPVLQGTYDKLTGAAGIGVSGLTVGIADRKAGLRFLQVLPPARQWLPLARRS